MTEIMPEQVDNIIHKMTGSDVAVPGTRFDYNGGLKLYCDAKNQEQLNEFLDGLRPKLVVLVGFAGYGKSTFIGSLYHLLTKNLSYGGYNLVDSETYVGFERRVFLRRVNSYNTTDTKRTVLGENDILHLKLRSDNGRYHDILVSDKSGEIYSKYISSDEDIETDIVLENADMVVFFVDAEEESGKLVNHNLIVEKYESLLTRLMAQNKFAEGIPYVMVYTKIDKVHSEEQKRKLEERKDKICDVFVCIIGYKAESVYEVDSTDLENDQLNDLFGEILHPRVRGEEQNNLDWVRIEIENEK